MKKVFSLILLMSILFVMILSCNKTTGETPDVSTSNNTDVSTTKHTSYIDEHTLPAEDEYQGNNILSFVSQWKKQQSVSENEDTRYDWKSIDGSPETSLLIPKSISNDYEFCEVYASTVANHTYHRGYTSYMYGFTSTKEDCHYGIAVTVIKGNRNYDVFFKEELTYDDLEFFVNEFVMREDCSCYTCTGKQNRCNIIAYEDNAICIELPANKEWYMLYNGRIISVCVMDKTIMNSPGELFDYVSFEEIPLE